MRTVLILALTALLAGCGRNEPVSQVKYHDDGRKKPLVAMFDVLDSSEASMPWELSDEFSTELTKRIKKQDNLFLIRQDEIEWQYPLQSDTKLPFVNDTWLKENHPNADFLTLVELIEHDVVPRNPEKLSDENASSSYDLNVSARIKVIDVRDDAPKVILQEMINQSTYIPSQLANIDYNGTRWGKTMFLVTPVGLAHAKMEKAIVKRIEDYVMLAKSH